MVCKRWKQKHHVKIIQLCRVARRLQQSQSYFLKTPLHLLIMGVQNAMFINGVCLDLFPNQKGCEKYKWE